jgi:hypothetical protein
MGKVADMGKVSAMAALIDCTDERIARLREFSGILDEVFISDDAARALLDARKPAKAQPAIDIVQADIVSYCRAQLNAAKTEEERRAAEITVSVEAVEPGEEQSEEDKNETDEHGENAAESEDEPIALAGEEFTEGLGPDPVVGAGSDLADEVDDEFQGADGCESPASHDDEFQAKGRID